MHVECEDGFLDSIRVFDGHYFDIIYNRVVSEVYKREKKPTKAYLQTIGYKYGKEFEGKFLW